MRQCHHPNICKVIDAYIPRSKETFNSVWLVIVGVLVPSYEIGIRGMGSSEDHGDVPLHRGLVRVSCPLYSLSDHLRLSLSQCCRFHSHSPQSANIMHRDVKPSNILMDTQCGIHVIDFGLARRISPAHHAPRSDSATISVASTLSADTVMDPALETVQEPAPHPVIERPVLQRQLTRHVATRWYRAPEIIILEVVARTRCDVETLLLRRGHVVDRLHLRSRVVGVSRVGGAAADSRARDSEAVAALPRRLLLPADAAARGGGDERAAEGVRREVAPAAEDLRGHRDADAVGLRGT